MSQPIINNEVKKEEYTRPSEPPKSVSTDSPKPAETPKKGFFSFFGNPFSKKETKEECMKKCEDKYKEIAGGKKHRSKKNKNSKRKTKKTRKSKSKKSKK